MAQDAASGDGLCLVYAGTPDFAVPGLLALADAGHEIPLVLTQPDRPAGRGRRERPPPVKRAALDRGLTVLQPERLDESVRARLAELAPDLMVVAAYGLLLSPAVLDLPRLGCINIHASLLPRWRGAAPIQRAILAGDSETGISIMQMEKGLDTGPVLSRHPVPITAEDTGGSLHDRLAECSGPAVVETVARLARGEVRPEPQPADGVTHAPRLSKAEARLDWSRPAIELERAVRAFQPWPVAFTTWRDQTLRIHGAQLVSEDGEPGHIVHTDGAGPVVAAGEGALQLTRVQLPGRRTVSGADFVNAGARRGEVLGA